MTSFLKTRRLAKNYKKILDVKGLVERYLDGESASYEKLVSFNIKPDEMNLLKLVRYIDIYTAMFEKSLKNIKAEDKQAVEEIYKKGKSVINYSVENYMCESRAYKSLKSFDVIFYYDILKASRIVNPLLKICTYKKRRIKR